jgi:hypothetical protein
MIFVADAPEVARPGYQPDSGWHRVSWAGRELGVPAIGRGPGGCGLSSVADDNIDRVLVVVAHPDDAEFWAGGTIAGWVDEGTVVTYCVLTDGDAGGFDPKISRGEIPRIRRAEQRDAAALLGVNDVRFLGLPEGSLRDTSPDPHEKLVRVIRQVRPQRVVTWSPEWNWERFCSCHPAHRATRGTGSSETRPVSARPGPATWSPWPGSAQCPQSARRATTGCSMRSCWSHDCARSAGCWASPGWPLPSTSAR